MFIFYSGGWPLIGLPGDGTPWDINGTQFMMEKLLGSPAFVDVSVKENFLNASLNLITVSKWVYIDTGRVRIHLYMWKDQVSNDNYTA